MRNHTLNLILKDYKTENIPQGIYLQYRGEFKSIKKTGHKIKPTHWDRNKRTVKDKFANDYPELIKSINNFQKNIQNALVRLENKEITPQTALEQILAKPFEDKSLSEFIDDWLEIGLKKGTVHKV